MFKGGAGGKGKKDDGVKVEFVYCDGAREDVQLSGDWNDWKAIQMFHEGGGMWSVVTPVAPGAHEFKFIVDGEWKHSNRHPTIGIDETSLNNVRVVLPEPTFDAQKTQSEVQRPFKSKTPTSATPSDTGSSSTKSKGSAGSKAKAGGLFARKKK